MKAGQNRVQADLHFEKENRDRAPHLSKAEKKREHRTASRQGGGPQFLEEPVQNKIRLSQGGGARGGSRPPRVESNAPEALLCKDSGKRSEDFCAAVRRKSNGIFAGCQKSPWTFLTA